MCHCSPTQVPDTVNLLQETFCYRFLTQTFCYRFVTQTFCYRFVTQTFCYRFVTQTFCYRFVTQTFCYRFVTQTFCYRFVIQSLLNPIGQLWFTDDLACGKLPNWRSILWQFNAWILNYHWFVLAGCWACKTLETETARMQWLTWIPRLQERQICCSSGGWGQS